MQTGPDETAVTNVSPSTSSPTFETPWRNVTLDDREPNLSYVRGFKPPAGVKHLRILLHGPPGAGKSSFINSVDSVLRGRIATRALAARAQGRSFTSRFKTYKIERTTKKGFYPFVYNDSMGIDRAQNSGICVEDIILILKGHVNEGYTFIPDSKLLDTDANYNKEPVIDDKVHVLVCVVAANTIDGLDDETVRKIREVRQAASDLDIPQIAILTKIDMACAEVTKDIRNAYKSKSLKKKMETLSQTIGIPMNCIFPVKNYHLEIDTEGNIDTLILSAQRKILDYGEDFLKDQLSQSSCSVL